MSLQFMAGILAIATVLLIVDMVVDDPSSGHYDRQAVVETPPNSNTPFYDLANATITVPVNGPGRSFAIYKKPVYIDGYGEIWCVGKLSRRSNSQGIQTHWTIHLRGEDCLSKREIPSYVVKKATDGSNVIIISNRTVRASTAVIHIRYGEIQVPLLGSVPFVNPSSVTAALKEIWVMIIKGLWFSHSYLEFFPMNYIQMVFRIVISGTAIWAFLTVIKDAIARFFF